MAEETRIIVNPDPTTFVYTGGTINLVGSGDTTVTQSGSTYIIYTIATGATVNWGSIGGTITDQTDLNGYLQSITANTSNITANNNAITGLTSAYNTHTGDTSIHYAQSAITITESQISDNYFYTGSTHPTGVTSSIWHDGGLGGSFLQLSTGSTDPTEIAGRMYWSLLDGTATLDLLNDVHLQLGQEVHQYVHNGTGSLISNGQITTLNGSTGERPNVRLATTGDTDFFGMATQDIANGSKGYVTKFGLVRGLNTNAFNEGDIIYLDPSTPGAYTNVRPSHPSGVITIGIVIIKNPSNGAIFVNPARVYSEEIEYHYNEFTGHTANTTIHYAQSAITITESQISDLQNYALQSELTGYTSINTFTGYTANTSTTLSSLQTDIDTRATKLATLATITGATTIDSTYSNKIVECDGTFTITLPTGITGGFQVTFVNVGSGSITFAAGTGGTLRSKGGAVTLPNQYGAASVYYDTNTTTMTLIGDIE